MSQFVPFRQLTREQWGNLGKVGAVVASLLFLAIFIFQATQSGGLGNDFIHFYGAAHSMLKGENPYTNKTDYVFVSALWAAVPYLTVGFYSTRLVAIYPWLAESLLFIAAIEFLVVQLVIPKKVSRWAWFPLYLATFVFTNNGWFTGQPTVVMAMLIYLSFWLLIKRNQPFWAGVAGFVAFTFKPQVAILLAAVLAIWCLRKAYRSYWLGCVVSVLIGLAVTLPFEPTWPYDVFATYTPDYMGNDSWAESTLLDWLRFNFQITGLPANILYAVLVVTCLACLVRFFWAANHHLITLLELLIVTDAVEMAITLYTRDYDYPLLVLPIFWVVSELIFFERRRFIKIFCFVVLAFFVLYYLRGGSWLYQMYVINLTVMVLTLWRAWLRSRSRQAEALASPKIPVPLDFAPQA